MQLPCRSDNKTLYVVSVLDVCDMVCVDLSSCRPVAVSGVYFMLWCVVVQLLTCMAGWPRCAVQHSGTEIQGLYQLWTLQYTFTLLRNSLTGEKKAHPNLCYVIIIIISSSNLTAMCGPLLFQYFATTLSLNYDLKLLNEIKCRVWTSVFSCIQVHNVCLEIL